MTRIRIFTASPGDVHEERDTLSDIVVPELQRIFRMPNILPHGTSIDVESIRWETHSWPDIGTDVQDVINQQISPFDILVGIMWKRFGTPTGRAGSGTEEEFERAYRAYEQHGRPRIMFYFRKEPFFPSNRSETKQLDAVFAFKERLEERGVLYWQYQTPTEFERFVREHLIRQILDSILPESGDDDGPPDDGDPSSPPSAPAIFISYAQEDRDAAHRLYNDLVDSGNTCWLDTENLLPGQDWQMKLESAIHASTYFAVLLSAKSMSKTGFVQKEVRIALDKLAMLPMDSRFLIPIRLDDCKPSRELADVQSVDMFPDWDEGVAKIIAAANKAG